MAGNNNHSEDSFPEPTYDEMEASLGRRKRRRKPTNQSKRESSLIFGTKRNLLWISSAVVAFLFLCGGVACYFTEPRCTETLEEVLALQSEILHLAPLPGHQPISACRHSSWGRKIKVAVFGKESLPINSLMIIETQHPKVTDTDLDEAFARKTAKSGPDQPEFSETRLIMVEGQQRSFQFSKQMIETGPGTEVPTWTVYGIVFSKSGTATLYLTVPESEYDEAAVIRMLESIHR